ncbi:hypothetical protein AcW1_007219, partial [Taiwanofungus camphoratus]
GTSAESFCDSKASTSDSAELTTSNDDAFPSRHILVCYHEAPPHFTVFTVLSERQSGKRKVSHMVPQGYIEDRAHALSSMLSIFQQSSSSIHEGVSLMKSVGFERLPVYSA